MFLFVAFSTETVQDDINLYENIDFPPNIHMKSVYHQKSSRILLNQNDFYSKPVIPNIKEEIANRKPFIVYFDVEQTLTEYDKNQCHEVGQKINWMFAPNYTCKEIDIFTDEKKKALNITLQNVKNYIEKMLSVKHELINLSNQVRPDLGYEVPSLQMDVDHYIKVWVRPFNDNTIGASGIINKSESTQRPVHSEFFLSSKYIPSVAQSRETIPRSYFNVLFHEFSHSIGMLDDFIPYWVNQETGYRIPQNESIRRYTDKYGQNHMMVCTLNAKRVAQQLLKRNKTDDGMEMCLEFEDLGGSGSIYTHPKATIYRQDVMAGINPHDGVISPVICSLLADIGFYSVNWSMCEKITWLSDELLSYDEIQNLSRKPTYKTFPKRYIYEPNTSFVAHDLRGYMPYVLIYPYNITKDVFKIAKYEDLYIPPTRFCSGTSLYDYAMLKNPTNPCQRNQWAMQYKNESGVQAFCSNSSLSNGKFTFLDINNKKHKCMNGESVNSDGITYYCPDLELMQKVINYLGADYFIDDFKTKRMNLLYYVIIPSVGLLIVIILIIVILISVKKLRSFKSIDTTSGLIAPLIT